MQWADSEAKFILNFAPLNMPDHHHAYQHEKGFQPDALFKIYKWYASNFAYLLTQLDAVKEGDGTTLLDNTLVFWVSGDPEAQRPRPDEHAVRHRGQGARKVRTGRWMKVQVPSRTTTCSFRFSTSSAARTRPLAIRNTIPAH